MRKQNLGRTKIFQDMLLNKSRSLLVIFAVVVGVGSYGMMATGRDALKTMYTEQYMATNPAHAVISMPIVDETLIDDIEALDGVAQVEMRRRLNLKLRNDEGGWSSLTLFAVPDLRELAINSVDWQGETAIALDEAEVIFDHEIGSLAALALGDNAEVRGANGETVRMRTAGFVNELALPPTALSQIGIGFISAETIPLLSDIPGYNELFIVTDVTDNDLAAIETRITEVVELLEANGGYVIATDIPEPGIYPRSSIVESVMVIMQATGWLILALSIIVVGNVIAALMAQQKNDIAILKSLGSTRADIVRTYLNMVLVIGTLALLIAIPQGYGSAWGLVFGVMSSLDLPMATVGLPVSTLLGQMALAYLVPLIAVLIPVLNGTRITIREAMSGDQVEVLSGGLTGLLKSGSLITRGAMRNTFRNKGRLMLTFLILSVAGGMFMAVRGLSEALNSDFEKSFGHSDFDIAIDLERPIEIDELLAIAQRVDGATDSEAWLTGFMAREHADGRRSSSVPVFAVPQDSALSQPQFVAGDWFTADDGANASAQLILSDETLTRFGMERTIGDEAVAVDFGRNTTPSTLSGGIGVSFDPIGFVRYDDFADANGLDGMATRLVVRSTRSDIAWHTQVESDLLDEFAAADIAVARSTLQEEVRRALRAATSSVSGVLLASVVIVALVGGIGLSSTLGINVIERTREIGVLRSIGTSDRVLSNMVIGEGMFTSLLSIPAAALLSIPLNLAIGGPLGNIYIGQPLTYTFSVNALLLWIAIVSVITLVACIAPARRAARLTIREALAYTG